MLVYGGARWRTRCNRSRIRRRQVSPWNLTSRCGSQTPARRRCAGRDRRTHMWVMRGRLLAARHLPPGALDVFAFEPWSFRNGRWGAAARHRRGFVRRPRRHGYMLWPARLRRQGRRCRRCFSARLCHVVIEAVVRVFVVKATSASFSLTSSRCLGQRRSLLRLRLRGGLPRRSSASPRRRRLPAHQTAPPTRGEGRGCGNSDSSDSIQVPV